LVGGKKEQKRPLRFESGKQRPKVLQAQLSSSGSVFSPPSSSPPLCFLFPWFDGRIEQSMDFLVEISIVLFVFFFHNKPGGEAPSDPRHPTGHESICSYLECEIFRIFITTSDLHISG